MKSMSLYRLNRWDGGDQYNPTPFYFSDKSHANTQKSKYDTLSRVDIIVLDPGDKIADAEMNKTAVQALSRLSPKERQSIGLPKDLQEAIKKVTGS